jgi:hypothetical protein
MGGLKQTGDYGVYLMDDALLLSSGYILFWWTLPNGDSFYLQAELSSNSYFHEINSDQYTSVYRIQPEICLCFISS